MYCLLSYDAVAVSLIKPCIKIVNTVVYNILSSVCNDVHNDVALRYCFQAFKQKSLFQSNLESYDKTM